VVGTASYPGYALGVSAGVVGGQALHAQKLCRESHRAPSGVPQVQSLQDKRTEKGGCRHTHNCRLSLNSAWDVFPPSRPQGKGAGLAESGLCPKGQKEHAMRKGQLGRTAWCSKLLNPPPLVPFLLFALGSPLAPQPHSGHWRQGQGQDLGRALRLHCERRTWAPRQKDSESWNSGPSVRGLRRPQSRAMCVARLGPLLTLPRAPCCAVLDPSAPSHPSQEATHCKAHS